MNAHATKHVLATACLLVTLVAVRSQTAGTCSYTPKPLGICASRPPAGAYQCAPDSSICCTSSTSAFTCPVCGAVSFKPSVQWGCSGEQWNPSTSRLLDYSFAGYKAGMEAVPSPPVSADLKVTYGAKGDGKTDDTQALLDAIDDAVDQTTVLYLPPGRYLLSKRIDISKRVILRGAGRNLTTLVFTKSLTDLGTAWTGNSPHTYGPALLNWWGTGKTDASSLIARVTRNATRGSMRLYVSSTALFSTNAWMRLLLDNVNNQMLSDLNGFITTPEAAQNNRTDLVQFNFRVTQVGPDYIDFDRPLSFNVSTNWNPEIHTWASYTRTEVGIEKLTIECPWTPYNGMNTERGWNALNFWWTPHSWIDDVTILNADLGVIVDGSPFFTVSDLQLGVTQRRAATYDGTWGIWLKNAADVLITRFNISAVFTQDIAVQAVQASTVISNGVGRNLSINPLYAGPYGILVSNVNFGQASLPYGLSGVAPKVSSFFTFWNVKSNAPLTQPRAMYGPRMTWIGARLATWTGLNSTLQWYIENNNTVTWPFDLQADQLKQRLSSHGPDPPYGPGYGCDAATSRICCIGFSNATCPACLPGYGIPSKLWGCKGELADAPTSLGAQRLMDWSYAGYMAGEMPIPRLPLVGSVMDFGAVGDGVADDTKAFMEAIDAIGRQGTLLIPAGRYLIRQQLNINNRVVLRGQGPAKTRLVFPKPLSAVQGAGSYTYGPAFIQFNGANWLNAQTFLATVTANAVRGQGILRVSDSTQFTPGQWVRLVMDAPAAGGIVTNMTMGIVPETTDYKNKPGLLSFNSRVSVVGVGYIKLERELPYNVSTAWKPALHTFELSLTRKNVGVEDLTIEFPLSPYKGFGTEAGYNALYFWSTAHCWVRNVAIINADMGVAFDGTHFCTIDGLQLSSGGRGVNNGAWGVWLKNGADTLIKNFNAQARMVRDIAVQGLQPGTVIVNSTGADLAIQTMAAGPYGLLLSNVNVGYGSRPWGQTGTTQSASSFMTVWNLNSQVKMPAPHYMFGPLMNFAGFFGNQPSSIPAYRWYSEGTTAAVFPRDLYSAQLLARVGTIPAVNTGSGQVTYQSPGYGCNGWTKCLIGTSNTTMAKCPTPYTSPSRHWGCAGELWNPAGRLPADWSFAGYQNGDQPIPTVPVVANVKNYGAKGDNITDDTNAFLAALNDAKVNNGAILIPQGVYRITKTLDTRKNIVLRGAGKGLTTLYFPFSLTQVYGNTWSEGGPGSNVSDYSHGTGFLNWWGWDPVAPDRTYLTDVTAAVKRGATTLNVGSTAKMSVGMWVRINLDDPGDGSLVKDLSGGYMYGGPNQQGARSLVRHLSRITALGTNWIRLERPMISNISLSYKPQVHAFQPLTTNAGIEYLTVAFPLTKYPGHLMEAGYNGIHFNQVAHSWVRDVRVVNSDSAFYSWGMVFCTLTGLEVASGDRGYDNGHRGIWLERGQDNLIVNFNFTTKMYHDLSVSFYEHSTAFVNGTGKDTNMDHHRAAPHSILWSNINTGIGSRTFESSGDGGNNGNHTASFITFWNVKGKLNALLPEPDFGPNLNFIGLKTEDWIISPYNWMLEKPPLPFGPADLYTAQKLTRASRLVQPPGARPPCGICAPSPAPIGRRLAQVSSARPPAATTTRTTSPIKRFYFF